MSVKLKTKVTLGVVFLLILLVLVGGTGYFFLQKSTQEQQDILKENYETLDYTRVMLETMDDKDPVIVKSVFESNLALQEKNITEPGEAEATKQLGIHYQEWIKDISSSANEILIRRDLSRIMQINLHAIAEKNKLIGRNAGQAKTIITILLTACALIGFTFVFNFPGYIAGPVVKLTEGIRGISGKQYAQRIHLHRTDEFGEMAEAFNQMAEELDRYEHSNLAKILFEKQRAEAVINSLKDASIGVGSDGRILFANTQALQLLNLKEEDILGKNTKVLVGQNDLFRFLMEEKSSRPFKIVVDNKEQFFTLERIEISNTEGLIGEMTVLKNITPYQERDVAKTNFIATVSHELKTPLASSDISLKLLEDERIGILNDEQKELVHSLKGDNQRLLKILSELLDLSQVESGKIQLTITSLLPVIPIRKAVEAVTAAAQQKNIRINTDIPDNMEAVKGDAEKIEWVLINLLTNAVKFSPINAEVNVSAVRKDDHIFFSVRDTGTGIMADHLPHLFDRFYQVPGTGKAGTGLGLSISKEFVEALGGKIGVESEPGKGSLFYFSLPLA